LEPILEQSWKKELSKEFQKNYFKTLKKKILQEKTKNTIYPNGAKIFRAFELTPFINVKVVILGQDPYHNEGQANGLCFSVNENISHPPSLKNIFKEIKNDLKIELPISGNLERWANQGVLLLNSILTVNKNQAGSHKNFGWENFTDKVIQTISTKKNNIIFLLWGKFAQSKSLIIDNSKHHILVAAHPSPFSANKGFFGCKHFSKTNQILYHLGKEEIKW
tara:strand:+ start:1438 stop:2100 length:663 start_codon:yes stop_codon:yes gene_type:complete